MSILSLEHISKRYPDGRRQITVLDDVSFDVEEGEFVGVWGMRRSGKTTLLQIAAGRQLPDEGIVRFDGRDTTGLSSDRRARSQRRHGIGLLESDWRPQRNDAVVEHVALPLLSDGLSLREARGPAWQALGRVGVADRAHLPVARLSHGERIRVALAQLLVQEPRVLLVDEPATLLRPSEGVDLYALLRSLGRDSPLAIVIASEEVGPLREAGRLMSIADGKLRSMDERGTLVQFPPRTPARRRSQP